jgi:hypothetical protein
MITKQELFNHLDMFGNIHIIKNNTELIIKYYRTEVKIKIIHNGSIGDTVDIINSNLSILSPYFNINILKQFNDEYIEKGDPTNYYKFKIKIKR